MEETAEVLDVPQDTVMRDWKLACGWPLARARRDELGPRGFPASQRTFIEFSNFFS